MREVIKYFLDNYKYWNFKSKEAYTYNGLEEIKSITYQKNNLQFTIMVLDLTRLGLEIRDTDTHISERLNAPNIDIHTLKGFINDSDIFKEEV
jgi:hypothetical protein